MKHLVVILFFAVSYSGAATAQEGSKKHTLPLLAGLPDTLSTATLAKVRSVLVMPDGTRTLLDSAAKALFVDRPFRTHPMPNAYLGDSCITMPNAYQGDDCVPMPNVYRPAPGSPTILRDSTGQNPWQPRLPR